MEELYWEGKVKVIGVANFEIQHLENLKRNSNISPMINQIETHPEFPQNKLHDYLVEHQILHEAWEPLAQENKALFENKELKKIADNHNKTVAQVILRCISNIMSIYCKFMIDRLFSINMLCKKFSKK